MINRASLFYQGPGQIHTWCPHCGESMKYGEMHPECIKSAVIQCVDGLVAQGKYDLEKHEKIQDNLQFLDTVIEAKKNTGEKK